MNWTHIHWQSWADFWAMGGYGVYVWGSMAVTFGLMLAEVWMARAAHAQALREAHAMAAMIDHEAAE